MWSDFIKKYFGFTRSQSRGVFVLLVLCFVVVLIRIGLSFYPSESKLIIRQLPFAEIDTSENKNNYTPSTHQKTTLKLFSFNPNTVTYNQLIELGVNAKSAKALINFRKKGFVFREKKDLLKVYGFNETKYQELEKYIILEKSNQLKQSAQNEIKPLVREVKPTDLRVELNSADSSDLIQLKGIGPSYAKRILKYRNLLGGFIKTEQLLEVYGFTEELYKSLLPSLTLNSKQIQKLNLNSDVFKIINRHPYVSYELCKQIVNTRKNLKLDEQILKDLVLDDVLYSKLLPYCVFD